MSPLTVTQAQEVETTTSDWDRLCRLGGIVAWIQLGCLLFSLVSLTLMGSEPETAEETFAVLQGERLTGLLRLDLATLLMIALFPFVAIALYAAFRKARPAYALLMLVLVRCGTLLALANHSAFSLLYLSDLHATATTAVQTQLLAAGEAIIAGNMWNTSAGFLAGLFMQGGFAFISWVMLSSDSFSKGTAYSGLLANGLDFIHVPVMLFAPTVGTILLAIGGIFYLTWFPLLGRDLIRLGRHGS
jgi:hypothetical protein